MMGELPMQTTQSSPNTPAFADPDSLIFALYDQVTFPPGANPDWDFVKTMFLNDAIIVLRTSKEKTSKFSVLEWVEDFVKFIEKSKVEASGFEEEILKIHTIAFGDIAHSWVLYRARIPGSDRSSKGVDSFQLVKTGGRWWIASILNEIPGPGKPLPEVLKWN